MGRIASDIGVGIVVIVVIVILVEMFS